MVWSRSRGRIGGGAREDVDVEEADVIMINGRKMGCPCDCAREIRTVSSEPRQKLTPPPKSQKTNPHLTLSKHLPDELCQLHSLMSITDWVLFQQFVSVPVYSHVHELWRG